jgi:menaquinol-cytochrome c reductase iron-sulfur subunit
VVARGEDNYTVFSPICTHLGCAYNWNEERSRFECPCHNSVFDIEGRVVSGPAPRPLDTYEVKVEGERLFVGALLRGEA